MQIIEEINAIRASEADIAAFEAEIGFALPADFRQFLQAKNGGRPQPSAFFFQTSSGDSDSLVDWFYSLSDDPIYSIRKNVEIFHDRIPVGMLAIGCDPLGNQLLLGKDGLFFWDHELEGSESETNVVKIAETFSEFIEMLGEL